MSGPLTFSGATSSYVLKETTSNPFIQFNGNSIFNGLNTSIDDYNGLYYYKTNYGNNYLYIIHPFNANSYNYQINSNSATFTLSSSNNCTLYYYLIGGGGSGNGYYGGSGGDYNNGNVNLTSNQSFNITIGCHNSPTSISLSTNYASSGSVGVINSGNKSNYKGKKFTDYGFSINKNVYFYGGGGGYKSGGGNGFDSIGGSGGYRSGGGGGGYNSNGDNSYGNGFGGNGGGGTLGGSNTSPYGTQGQNGNVGCGGGGGGGSIAGYSIGGRGGAGGGGGGANDGSFGGPGGAGGGGGGYFGMGGIGGGGGSAGPDSLGGKGLVVLYVVTPNPSPTITPATTQTVTYPATTSTTLTAKSNSTGALTYYLSTSGATSYGNASVTTSSNTGTTFVAGNLWVACGRGTNNIAYSNDGINWTGITGNSIFYIQGRGAAWNGTLWVAVGQGTNSIAYSNDGITWTGLGSTIFGNYGKGVAWNGTLWVAVGFGTNTIAYSNDGLIWTGITGTTIFSTIGRTVAWNRSLWVAGGEGTNGIAYSNDGITWTGLGTTIFGNDYGALGIAWNGTLWVAVGQGTTNTIAYSSNGTTWTGLGTTIFGTYGRGIAWNGTLWVAGGSGTNTIAYSSNGTIWTGLGTNFFFGYNGQYDVVTSIAWNGTLWVAVGYGNGNTISYSNDGIIWTGLGSSVFQYSVQGVASNAGYAPVTSYTANLSITGPGTINTYVTEAADANYDSITTPVATGTINVQGSPSINATTQTVRYNPPTSININPTSNSTGAFTFSLQAGFPSGTSIDSTSGVLTVGGLGTIVVLVTQAASGNFTELTNPTVATTITVIPLSIPTIRPDIRSVTYPVTQLFTVTNNGAGSYAINGTSNPTLNLFRGITYYFDLNASGHPFWLKTAATTGTGDQYNDGVTNNGTQTGRITFSVPYNAPSIIYYACQFHGSMQGTINISDFVTTVVPVSTNTGGAFAFSLQAGFPAGTSINSTTGALIIGGLGTINVLVTQAFYDIYAAVTTPVAAGTITVVAPPTPKITPNNRTVIYTAPTSINISPISTNAGGAFNFSLQSGFPAGTSIVPSTGVLTIGGIGTIVVLVTQTAAGIYSAVTTPVVGGTITVTNTKTGKVTPSSDSTGAFTYSLDTQSSTIASINSTTGDVTVTGFGTVNVYVIQDVSGDYAAVTSPVLAGSIISLFTPVITPAATQNATYLQTAKVTVTPTSDSTGAFTFSLQPGYQGCTTVDPNTGVVTIGGTGTITVLATQAATSSYGPVTTPAVAGTIIVDFSPIPCFKEGTQILTIDGYRLIQDLRKGDLVKTLNHGYVGINMIGCQIIYNRKETIFFDKMHKCSNENYPEIFEDLYITGLHAVLVDGLTDEQQRQIKCVYNDSVYVTDDKYRLPVCFDKRATPHETDEDEQVVIFHLALDHENENLNYGIYANGLLVETTSIELMKESGLIMVE